MTHGIITLLQRFFPPTFVCAKKIVTLVLIQFPGKLHMAAADHVLRYLRGTYEKGILFSRGAKHTNLLWGWVDADWAGDTDTRRSHTGFVLMFNDGPISWKSRR